MKRKLGIGVSCLVVSACLLGHMGAVRADSLAGSILGESEQALNCTGSCTDYDENCCGDDACNGCTSADGSQDKPWSFSFTQTVDYVQNLALPIALTPANTVFAAFQDDMQFQTSARLQRTWKNDEESFSAAYGFYQSLHPRVNELDLLTHTLYLQYARQVTADRIVTVDYSYAYNYLDFVSFVSQNRIGVSSQRRVNDQWDVKTRADYANANFRGSPALTSDNYSGQLELVRYLDDKRQNYVNAGYGVGWSDAQNDGFTYLLNNVFVGARYLLGPDDKTEFRPTVNYGQYNFEGTDPLQVGTVRHDEIFVASALLSRTISDRWSAFGSYTYLNSDSNVVRQFYHQNVISLGVSGNW